jgi:hypothetical protein
MIYLLNAGEKSPALFFYLSLMYIDYETEFRV